MEENSDLEPNPEQTPTPTHDESVKKEQEKELKNSFIKWNGEINFGNALTIVTISIAAIALFYQKKLVDAKVDDLQIVVKNLEDEKQIRELQDLKLEEKNLNSFSSNLSYTTNQLRASDKLYTYEFIMVLSELNKLLSLSLKQKGISNLEKDKLKKMINRNALKIEIFSHGEIYQNKIIEFEKKYKPSKDKYKTIDDYIVAEKIYSDTLQKHIEILQQILDSLLAEPSKKINQLGLDYLEYSKENN
ncbi:hypothetical protein SAMN04488109_0251 [Chryseolinea serpens]|uniref:Uncharacterized protein n=1 Tax=Chryseolinea serpens TaxID=947013 RepID=A0A1M5JRW5_9BACT|nr:hypothetical protein [Chryseolinea serpens]SHG43258.1 hypothetical protein SAMN04488109_0251 [Chryseolinea serpens]